MLTYHPHWNKLAKLYKINDLAFQGEYSLKNSELFDQIVMYTDTMTDPKNPKSEYLKARYKQSALYTNYPAKYLKQAQGLINKEYFELKLPNKMQKIEDYATLENQSLQVVYNSIMEYIIKFGSALLITVIPDEVSIANEVPRIEVIPGCDVLDGESFYDKEKNLDAFKRLVYYKQEYKFNYDTNSYEIPQIYIYVKGINQDGIYYEAKMKEQDYSRFNFDDPELSKEICVSLSYPKWNNFLNFIPAVYVNKDDLKLEWKESPIQNLIEKSLSIFQMTADIRFLSHQQSSSTLIISGTDMEQKAIRTGVGSVINLVESGSKAEFIAPSVAGLQSMISELENMHELAKEDLLDLTSAGSNSSGEALNLRISDKTSELLSLVMLSGKAIQRELEMIANIIGENIDNVEFIPYTKFGIIELNNEKENINKI